MCGILAIFCRNEQRQHQEITAGYETLTKRGPDCGSLTFDNSNIFGFRRLSIVDTSEAGNQPFYSGDVTLLCNGEIYNHKYLEETYDLQCESKSDCECIIHLYKKIGFDNTIKLLDGVFAIVLVDKDNVYIARDRIGIRPLFYGITNDNNFCVASTSSAITGYCKWTKPFKPSFGKYDIRYNRIRTSKYEYARYDTSGGRVCNIINETLTRAVSKRLMTDRPMCCMLSGGLDSSLVTSILCKLIGSENVRTYSIGMEGSQDLKYAKIVSEYLGTQHTEVTFTPEEGFAAIPEIIKDLESYDITTVRASVGMWLLAKYISENSDNIVVLSGEGSDELLMGYLYFHYAPSVYEADKESRRLIDQLYIYDVLRADRCISSHGLEPRVPFLDKYFVNLCLSISPELKVPVNGIEKYQLRKAFEDNYLPNEVLWRRKDGFSDGVSGAEKKWYEQIQEFVEEIISDEEFHHVEEKFPSKEAYFYKKTFDDLFPTFQPRYDYWLPKWVDHGGDPSGRNLQVYKNT